MEIKKISTHKYLIKLLSISLILTTLLSGCTAITSLTQASREGDLTTIDNLLRQGANINEFNPGASGTTALGWALKKCKYNAASALLSKGANMNLTNGEGTPVWFETFSCNKPDITFTKNLIEKVKDVNVKNKQGVTALGLALLNCNFDAASNLLNYEANPNLTDNDGYPMWAWAFSCGKVDVAFLELLLKKVKNVNIKDKEGFYVLSKISFYYNKKDYEKIVKILINKGLNASTIDNMYFGSQPAIIYAVDNNDTNLVKLLIDAGVNVNINYYNWTPLIYATYRNYPEVAKLLLDAGANINGIDNQGWTPLMFAAKYNYPKIAKLLVERGADVSIYNKDKKDVMSYTKKLFGENSVAEIVRNADKHYSSNLKNSNTKVAKVSAVTSKKIPVSNKKTDTDVKESIPITNKTETIPITISNNTDKNQFVPVSNEDNNVTQQQYFADNKDVEPEKTIKSSETDVALPVLNKKNDKNIVKKQYITKSDRKKLSKAETSVHNEKTFSASVTESDIDVLPSVKAKPNKNSYAIVIGIEKYRQKLQNADFAAADARIVTEYLIKVMGYPEENIVTLINEYASKSDLQKYFEKWLSNNVEKEGNVFIYYSGHGAPNPSTGDAYLVPYDGDPSFIEQTGYSLNKLYESLNKLEANKIIVALDSCFSGAGGRSVLAKGIRPLVMDVQNNVVLSKNITVMTAASGNQISSTYDEKGHGLFTYFMLKGIKEENVVGKDGAIDINDLFNYIKNQVERIARKHYNNEQSPQLIESTKN